MSVQTGFFLATAVAALIGMPHAANAGLPTMTVYASPYCSCCHGWIDAAKAHGFTVEIKEVDDIGPVSAQAGVPADLQGCHITTLDGYVLSGMVPFGAIDKLLAEHPQVRGIALPGMPDNAPGMAGNGNEPLVTYAFGGANELPAVFLSE